MKVALILPISTQNGQAAAQSLRNAAQLAVEDFSGGNAATSNIQIIVKDDRGTPEGARLAAQEAIQEGAELVLGRFSHPMSRQPPPFCAPPESR